MLQYGESTVDGILRGMTGYRGVRYMRFVLVASMVRGGTLRYVAVRYIAMRYGTTLYGIVCFDTGRFGAVAV